MSRVIAVVEGQTEQDFVRDLVAPWLATRGVFITARLVGKPGHKGGVGQYARAKSDIQLVLKSDPHAVVTTMFDFYGMPASWPGRQEAHAESSENKAILVENAIHRDIASELGAPFDASRFVPYVQIYEFEALLFSDVDCVCDVMRSPSKAPTAKQIRDSFATPEDINDDPMTAPSKRLLSLFADYRKRLHGLIAAKRIGIDVMRNECRHFNRWMANLEGLSDSLVE